MKKILFPIFISTGLLANAQEAEFGFSILNENISHIPTEGVKFSGFGWYARFFVSEKWAIQPELTLGRYRGKLTDTTSVLLDYMALPVLGRVDFTPAVFAYTGLQVAVLVSEIKEPGQAMDTYKRVSPSWLLGAGCSCREYGLEVSLRYNYNPGLNNIHAADNINSFHIVLNYRIVGGRPILR